MTLPNDIAMPNYIIYRDSPEGHPFDATAPLAFFPPKDSDELFDALRAEYPHFKTHSERMREATIAYLIQERVDEQSPATIATPLTTETSMTSPWLASFPSMSTDSSNFSSPDMLGLATPSFGNSPQSQAAQLHPSASRQPSVTGGVVAASSTTPPALENMTGVFSLSDSTQPKQRIRRKMTEAEKADYRKRRIVKACDKCSKRKRKCNHNAPEMETLSKSSQKVEKTKPVTGHHKKPEVIPLSLSPDPALDNVSAQPFIQGEDDWLDFTLLDDPMPEMSFDDLLQADLDRPLKTQQYLRNQWSWGTDEDFSMMFENDVPSENPLDVRPFNDHDLVHQPEPLADPLQYGGSASSFTTGNKKYPVGVRPVQQTWGGANGNDMLWDDLDTQQYLLDQQPDQRSRGGANGNEMLWEGLGTDQQAIGNPSLQRTPHTPNSERGDALIFDGHFGDSAGGSSSYSGLSAPRKELTRNIKNPRPDDVLHDLPDGGDRSIHQSESTSKNRRDRFDQANPQNRANVRSVEGSGTKDLLQSATIPHPRNLAASPDDATKSDIAAASGGRTRDASAELYRLRRRGIPSAESLSRTTQLQTKPQTLQTVSRADIQVNGGAYQRLDTNVSSTPSLTGLSAILPTKGAEKPVHTRARNPAASNSSSHGDQHSDTSTHFEGAGASNSAHSSRPRAHSRGHDTVRYRDHFGRLALVICTAVFGSFLLFCAAQQKSSLSLSMLLLALLAPSSSTQKQIPQLHKKHEDSLYWHAGNPRAFYEGEPKVADFQNPVGVSEALRGRSGKRGWVMTPHSSVRWSVRNPLCG